MHVVSTNPWRCISCACVPIRSAQTFPARRLHAPSSSARPATRSAVGIPRSPVVRRVSYGKTGPSFGNDRTSRHGSGHARRPGQGKSRDKSLSSITRRETSHKAMVSLIETRLCGMREKVTDPDFMLSTGLTKDTGREQFEEFAAGIMSALVDHSVHGKDWLPPRPYVSLRQAYELSGEGGLESQLRFMLQGHIANSGFKESDMLAHARLADLRFPHEWYPAARELHRHIHIHIGPTNSGKTYHALKRLEQAESGVYAGPLRLLAHEVYTRMNAQGKRCNLVTGDERIVSEDGEAALESCTVEMVPTGRAMDVAVIDEIQMIGHEHRGWAWTQALLGLRANEIHLCGEERALPLVRELVAATGDSLHVHKYERLTPLKTMSTSLKGDLKRLRKGDCVVMFSRRGIHAMKKEIEQTTGKKVAVVYGALPPEVRAQQARYFNDEDNDYDILVASDAVGMGLNLSIKRMIFESTLRISDGRPKPLPPSDIKQIGGRAGRFRVAPSISIKSADTTTVTEVSPDMAPQRPKSDEQTLISNDDVAEKKRLGVSDKTLGLVTSLHPFDLKFIERAMSATATPIISAGILPPDNVVVRFASYFPPRTPFSYILLRLHEISRMQSRFRLCQVSDGVEVADVIQSLEGLSIPDRLTFCAAPISLRDAGSAEIVKAYARCVEQQTEGALLDFSVLDLEMLDDNGPPTSNKLYKLELLHKALILYLWLSYRFSGIFTSQAMAFHVKKLVEDNIDKALESRPYNKLTSARFRKLKEMDLFLEQSHEEMNALYPNDTSEAATRLKQRAAVERDELFVLGKQGDIALKPVSSKIEVDQLTKL